MSSDQYSWAMMKHGYKMLIICLWESRCYVDTAAVDAMVAVVVGVFSFSFHLHRFVAIFLSFFHNTFHRSFDNFGWTIDFVLFIFFCKFCWTAGHVRKRSTAFIHHLIFFFRIEWTSFVFKNMAQNKKWFALYILSHSLWITHFV